MCKDVKFCQIVLLGTVDIIIYNFFHKLKSNLQKFIAFFDIHVYSHMGITQLYIKHLQILTVYQGEWFFSNVKEYYKQSKSQAGYWLYKHSAGH